MPLFSILIVIAVVGVLVWAFNTYVTTIDPKFKTLFNVVAIVGTVLWVLFASGLLGYVGDIRMVPPHR